MSRKPKSLPIFATEVEARQFWETHDLTDVIDGSRPRREHLSNLDASSAAIFLRSPVVVPDRIRGSVNRPDVPYLSLIKTWLTRKVDRV